MAINLPTDKFGVLEEVSCDHPTCKEGMCGCEHCRKHRDQFYRSVLKGYGVPEGACCRCYGTQHPVLTRKQYEAYLGAQTRAASAAVPVEGKAAATTKVLPPVHPKAGVEDEHHPKPGTIKGGLAALIASKKRAK